MMWPGRKNASLQQESIRGEVVIRNLKGVGARQKASLQHESVRGGVVIIDLKG